MTDDEQFWQQVKGDAKRTVLCEPHRLDDIQAAVEQRGLADLITVRASHFCPAGKLLVLDDSAMEASWQQTIQRAGRSLYR
ncbi:hypothetical protein [Streptomyces sp. NPDC001652]|uniref:hypothetical protein n=1 Tax=Streptomyces sp. NPDC001652 TaxID=3154393 RepID=UPI0033334899